jgi:hypothetical protein
MRDINLVQIASTRADIGTYNFVHAICSGEWFGFDTFDSHKFAPFCHTNTAMMDKLDDEIVQMHAEEGLPRVEHCTSIGYMSNVFRVDGYNSDELLPCFEKAHFQFMHENEQPTKRQCIRMRGGARVRAPARAPGDNTLPSRTPAPIVAVAAPVVATLAPIQVTPTAQSGKENIDPNFQNLEDLIADVDWDTNGITMDDIDMANQFDDSFWS